MSQQHSQLSPPAAILKALRLLLRPLVKLMLHHQITFPTIAKLLKEVFVEVAESDYKLEGKPQTDSRINLLTGVHRRDVKKLRNKAFSYEEDQPTSVTLGGQIISCWYADPKYQDENGMPLPLPRLKRNGGEISFEALVRSINKNIRPRAILDELTRLNIVHICATDNVNLNVDSFVPKKDLQEKAFYLGLNLHDHIAVCTHNLCHQEQAPMLERCLYYDKLTPDDLDLLMQAAEKKGMECLRELNQLALKRQTESASKENAQYRFNMGVYFLRGSDNDLEPEKIEPK